jgi:hypothetical protein
MSNDEITAPPDELQILNGGVELDVVKIDAGSERVKVRQLPIALVGQWGTNQNDEAFIVELLCDRIDKSTQHHLQHARMAEFRVLQMLQSAKLDEMGPIETRLQSLRTEIAALETKPRWSDTITHESAAQIRALGERLNKKKFVDQTKRNTSAAKNLLTEMSGSAAQNSSSPSQPSDTSSPAT